MLAPCEHQVVCGLVKRRAFIRCFLLSLYALCLRCCEGRGCTSGLCLGLRRGYASNTQLLLPLGNMEKLLSFFVLVLWRRHSRLLVVVVAVEVVIGVLMLVEVVALVVVEMVAVVVVVVGQVALVESGGEVVMWLEV